MSKEKMVEGEVAKDEKIEVVSTPEAQGPKGVNDVDVSDDEVKLIKGNLAKLSQYMQIMGQTTEQFEMAKANILNQIGKCREEHENITALILKKSGYDDKARVIDIDYANKKLKVAGANPVKA